MATESMIDMACRTDEELFRPSFKQIQSGHLIGELEEEADPELQALAARWLRRERPRGWRTILDALGLAGVDADGPSQAPVAPVDPLPAPVPVPAITRRDRRKVMRRPDWEWTQDAACRGDDLVLFFGLDGERQPERDIRERKAKAICARCPVRIECLDYALSRPEKYGTWGGLTEEERAAERRRLQRRGHLDQPRPLLKQCGHCSATKTTAEFGSDKLQKDGLNLRCKVCTNEAARRRRREAKEAAA